MIELSIAFTANYFVQAATLLLSVLKSSPEGNFHVICLLTDDLSARQKELLESLEKDRLSFEYLVLSNKLDGVYIDPRYTVAASLRLLLPELLPNLDKVLYLDCDMIIRQDLGKLWDSVDLGDNYLSAVYEAPIEKQSERITAIGCDPNTYFNSGFLFLNLAQMRKENVTDKLLDACRVDWLEFPDQDALNQVCQGRVLPLSPIYNSIRTFFIPVYKKDFEKSYSSDLWNKIQTSGNIHYTGGKPWDIFSVQFAQWWETYDKLPNDIKDEWVNPGRMLRFWKFYRHKPIRWIIDSSRSLFRKLK